MSASSALSAPAPSEPVLSVQGLQVAYGRGSRQKQVIFAYDCRDNGHCTWRQEIALGR